MRLRPCKWRVLLVPFVKNLVPLLNEDETCCMKNYSMVDSGLQV